MPAPSKIEGEPFGPPTNAQNVRGAQWIVASCIGATGMSVAVRYLSVEMHTVQIAFLRCVFGLWVLIPLFATRPTSEAKRLQFSRPWLHLLRGGLFVIALNTGFYAISVLPLATATTLFFMAPVFATLLAAVFRQERFGVRRAAAIAAAFIGVLIVLRPGFAEISWAMTLAIMSALCFSVALLISRPLAQADGATSILVSSSVIASIVMAFPVIWLWTPVGVELWGLVGLLVVASSLRMFADIRAYTAADAGFLAPFAFLRLLFITAAGWIFFQEGLDGPTALGAAMIIGATVFIAWREAIVRKRDLDS